MRIHKSRDVRDVVRKATKWLTEMGLFDERDELRINLVFRNRTVN